MRKYTVLGSLALFLVMFFQNCGKPVSNSSQELAGISPSNQQYNKYAVEAPQTLSLWDYLHARFLDIDLATGQMVAYERGGQDRGETFQVPADKMTALRAIMSGAEICEPIFNEKDTEGRVCTMEYRYPYATLSGQGDEVRLGEKTNGCDVPTDLCGEKAQQLKDWSKSLIESL